MIGPRKCYHDISSVRWRGWASGTNCCLSLILKLRYTSFSYIGTMLNNNVFAGVLSFTKVLEKNFIQEIYSKNLLWKSRSDTPIFNSFDISGPLLVNFWREDDYFQCIVLQTLTMNVKKRRLTEEVEASFHI